jgi:hypothetical protein
MYVPHRSTRQNFTSLFLAFDARHRVWHAQSAITPAPEDRQACRRASRVRARRSAPTSTDIDLQWLALLCDLNPNSFRRLGRTCILEVVSDAGRFLEGLTCLEGLRWPTFDLDYNGAFEDNNEPRRRVLVFARFRSRCDFSNPYVHFLAFHPGKFRLKKVGALNRRLLGIHGPVASHAQPGPNEHGC